MNNQVIAFTYSTPDFSDSSARNKETALQIGKVAKFFEFGPEDIEPDFYHKNEKILSQNRGAGLWLWKPYFFYRMLNQMQENEILLYTDAASYFVKNISGLIRYFETIGQDIMGFDLPLQSDQWTKEETFSLMNATKSERLANQISASFILIKKNKDTLDFAKEWLEHCCNIELMSEVTFYPQVANSKNYISHRYDQSIFSILYIKHGFKSYRDPSQYGVLPWVYILSENIIYIPSQKYVAKEYSTLFFHTRNVNNIKIFHLKTRLKLFLAKFPMYQKWEIRRRKKIQAYS
jgi:hypothetical protein